MTVKNQEIKVIGVKMDFDAIPFETGKDVSYLSRNTRLMSLFRMAEWPNSNRH